MRLWGEPGSPCPREGRLQGCATGAESPPGCGRRGKEAPPEESPCTAGALAGSGSEEGSGDTVGELGLLLLLPRAPLACADLCLSAGLHTGPKDRSLTSRPGGFATPEMQGRESCHKPSAHQGTAPRCWSWVLASLRSSRSVLGLS